MNKQENKTDWRTYIRIGISLVLSHSWLSYSYHKTIDFFKIEEIVINISELAFESFDNSNKTILSAFSIDDIFWLFTWGSVMFYSCILLLILPLTLFNKDINYESILRKMTIKDYLFFILLPMAVPFFLFLHIFLDSIGLGML